MSRYGRPGAAIAALPRGPVTRSRKPFDPAVGEVGSWVTAEGTSGLPVWGVRPDPVSGQVWARSSERGFVWVVDSAGRAFHCHTSSLVPSHADTAQSVLPEMASA